MKAFGKWLRKQLDELDVLESIYCEIDDPADAVEWIVQQAADRASRLDLELYRKSLSIKRHSIPEARWYLLQCLQAAEANEPKLSHLTVRQAAKRLGIGINQLYDLCRTKAVPCYQIGKAIRIRPEDLDEYVSQLAKPRHGYRHL
jgi:excisionase family DNA binding protein